MVKQTRGIIMLFSATLIWGTAFVAQRIGTEYIGAFMFNAARFFVGAAVLVPIIIFFRRKESHRDKGRDDAKATLTAGVICGLVLYGMSTLQQIGIAYTTVGKAGFITALYIVFVPIGGGLFFRKRVRWFVWVGIGIAVAGMYLLCITGALFLGLGDTLVFLCAIASAAHILLVDHLGKAIDSVAFACVQFFTCAVLSLLSAVFFEPITWSSIVAAKYPILYTGVLSCGVAYTFQMLGQKRVAPVITALILSMEAVFATISGWLILGEHLSARQFIGCALMLAAILFAQIPDVLNRRSSPPLL